MEEVMITAEKLDLAGQALVSRSIDLAYGTGEMPDIYHALSEFEAVGFLESREGTEKYARYGITIARPLLTVTGRGTSYKVVTRDGTDRQVTAPEPAGLLRSLQPEVEMARHLEAYRFAAGWVGSMGYEVSEQFEKIPRAEEDDIQMPDTIFYFPSIMVLKDGLQRRLTLVVVERDEASAEELLEQVAGHLAEVRPAPEMPLGDTPREAVTSFGKQDFLDSVSRIRELIYDGELIQCVISRRWEVTPAPEPMAVYQALSSLNPSPYHFYLELPDGVLLGASPELLVRQADEELTVRPIAGTRRRGANSAEDEALEEEMLADPKERAEHIMLVDLGRNDLGRVSSAGSVEVTGRMVVERYSHVMHLVSEVRSRIEKGVDAYDVLKASFPAGTVSGAPKIRAMQLVSELEPVVRGPYAGGVGYFDVRGNMDFCITIRSVFYSHGRAYIQSGAGIVADSVPERERDEIAAKAAAMFRAFGNVEFEE
jgi:anthranilate synthase component 1